MQRLIDRMLYGARRAPIRVFTLMGKRLESAPQPNQMISAIAETVGDSLKLPYVIAIIIVSMHEDDDLIFAAMRVGARGSALFSPAIAKRLPGYFTSLDNRTQAILKAQKGGLA